MRQIFDRADVSGNGKLSHDEIEVCIQQLGWTDVTSETVFSFLDKDQNLTLEFDEFLKWSQFAWKTRVLSFPKAPPKGGLRNNIESNKKQLRTKSNKIYSDEKNIGAKLVKWPNVVANVRTSDCNNKNAKRKKSK